MRRAVGPALALIFVYAGVLAWLTWPLARRVATHVPAVQPVGQFDTLFAAWALAWESHALATAPGRFFEANIFHPTPHALCYGQMGLGTLPYFLPTFLLTGNPALALNLTFMISLTLTALALHLVVWRATGSHLAGFVAAWTLLTTRWVLRWWPPVAPNYAVLQYFPLIVLVLARPALGPAAWLGLAALVVLQGASDIYVAVAVLAPLALLAAVRVLRPRRARRVFA